jgi:hypothetical protein
LDAELTTHVEAFLRLISLDVVGQTEHRHTALQEQECVDAIMISLLHNFITTHAQVLARLLAVHTNATKPHLCVMWLILQLDRIAQEILQMCAMDMACVANAMWSQTAHLRRWLVANIAHVLRMCVALLLIVIHGSHA